jgi:transglutaminase-like putative cysteine protease
MWLHATCILQFHIPTETPFILMLRPRSGRQQWIGREQYVLAPSVPVVEFTDHFGNLCQRLVAPAGPFSIRTAFDVEAADRSDTAPGAPFIEVQYLPNDTLPFLLPSRYCESDRFTALALSLVNGVTAGYDQCTTIVNYIRNTTTYAPGLGNDIISACEANQRTHAVCRDMAHIGIACCRALSIPARLVVGYLEGLEPMDQHAWFEAYVGGRWYTFDPTQDNLQGGRIAIAYGRDAADVAIYTQFGAPVDFLRIEVNVTRLAGPPENDISKHSTQS